MKIEGLLTQYKEGDIVRHFYDSNDLLKCSELFQILEIIDKDEFLVKNLKTGEEKLMDEGEIRLLSSENQKKVLEVLQVTMENILNKADELTKQLELFRICTNELGTCPQNTKSFKYGLLELTYLINDIKDEL